MKVKSVLLFTLFCSAPLLSFATKLDMNTLSCRDLKITSSTTLADVQSHCLIKKQTTSSGRYEVEFVNQATKKTVGCYFADKKPTTVVNSCHSVGMF